MLATEFQASWRARTALVLSALCAAPCPPPAAAQTGAPPGTLRLDRLPVPASASPVDIAAIASGYEAAANARGAAGKPSTRLLILVSFSMPPASLARLAGQARRAGGVLVLNGLKDGSLTATAQAIHRIFGQQGAPLQIDPRPFARHAVNAVPAFILLADDAPAPSCAGATCPFAGHVMATGDVSLDYALEQIATAQPAWRPAAQTILRRLGR